MDWMSNLVFRTMEEPNIVDEAQPVVFQTVSVYQVNALTNQRN